MAIQYKSLLKAALAIVFVGLGSQAEGAPAKPKAVIVELDAFGNPLDPRKQLNILSANDVKLYPDIFDLQIDGHWQQADILIKQLDSDILMGHVLFQRYMHPDKYRSKYTELRGWMAKYSDHPEAYRIYRLAMKRKPARARAPLRPVPNRWKPPDQPKVSAPRISKEKRRRRRAEYRVRTNIRRYLRAGRIDRAEKRLWAAENAGLFDVLAFHTQMSRIASAYFYKGNSGKAAALGAIAAKAGNSELPEASWISGLGYWKLGQWAEAAEQFSSIAHSPESSGRLKAAGSFWAARSYLRDNQPDRVNEQLESAASRDLTFYGLLSKRQLGEDIDYPWIDVTATSEEIKFAMGHAGIQRAAAFHQIGRVGEADREYRLAVRRALPGDEIMFLNVAADMKLVGSGTWLARQVLNKYDLTIYSALYPLPSWQPQDGQKLDQAFLWAVTRQESGFLTTAVSHAGARGLMQLMPATAAFIARDRSLRRSNKNKLFEPDFNMKLGQKYLLYLMDMTDTTEDNLVLVIGSYNGGPGNMRKWKNRISHGGDWLLFMESIPNRENRNYVERVLENLWIYRVRLGQPSPSLDQVASGLAPRYSAQDSWSAFKANSTPKDPGVNASTISGTGP